MILKKKFVTKKKKISDDKNTELLITTKNKKIEIAKCNVGLYKKCLSKKKCSKNILFFFVCFLLWKFEEIK